MINLEEILAPDEIIYETIYTGGEATQVEVKRSSYWQTTRNQVVLANPFCLVCKISKNLQVHHLKPFHLWHELELDLSNLFVLCREHHHSVGHLYDWKSYNPEFLRDLKRFKDKPYKKVPKSYFLA